MKIVTTSKATVDYTVERNGKHIGDVLHDMIADYLRRDETVTSITVDMTSEDWIALRLNATATAQASNTERPVMKNKLPYSSSHSRPIVD